jgi:hypothetical protein
MQTSFFFYFVCEEENSEKKTYAYIGGQHILHDESADSRYKPSRRNTFAHCFYIATHETGLLFNIPRSTHISGAQRNGKNEWVYGFQWNAYTLCRAYLSMIIQLSIHFGWFAAQKNIFGFDIARSLKVLDDATVEFVRLKERPTNYPDLKL